MLCFRADLTGWWWSNLFKIKNACVFIINIHEHLSRVMASVLANRLKTAEEWQLLILVEKWKHTDNGSLVLTASEGIDLEYLPLG